jgi:hypothetical protein
MNEFSVTFPGGKTISYSGQGAGYHVESGVLTLFDGKGKRSRFSPEGWVCVEDDQSNDYQVKGIQPL